MLMLDLCSGLEGASKAFRDRGHEVIRVELAEDLPAEWRDVTTFLPGCPAWPRARPDFIWASPPCTEFARESMPWCRTGVAPSLDIVRACRRVIQDAAPRFHAIENVRGALPYLGPPDARHGPIYLWGRFPAFEWKGLKRKEALAGNRLIDRRRRAEIPYGFAEALCMAIEGALEDRP